MVGRGPTVHTCCSPKKVGQYHKRLKKYHQRAMKGVVWVPILEYPSCPIDHRLMNFLADAWDRKNQAFKLSKNLIPFSIYDVVLVTSVRMQGKWVNLQMKEVKDEFEVQ